jgi:predicted nucleotidyltransferase
MLKIINTLQPFFEDCYRRINVREYARIKKISPPTAAKLLNNYFDECLLKREEDRGYIFYYANKGNKTFIELSRIFWGEKLKNLIEYLEKNLSNPTIILFGSLSKAECRPDSDLDLAIISTKKELKLKNFEKKLKKQIQVFFYNSIKEIKNKDLAKNIINGYVLRGKL